MPAPSRAVAPASSLAIAALLLGATPAASASCKREGTRTLASAGEIRVFERGRRDEERVYACSRRTGRALFLGEEAFPRGGKPEDFRIRGRFLTHSQTTVLGNGDVHLRVSLVDVRSRRRLTTWNFANLAQERDLRVRGARLKANGSFAFLVGATDGPFVGDPPSPGGPEYSVHMRDAAGKRVLDAGGDIAPRSFRATDAFVWWRRAGELRRSDFR